MNLKSLVLTFVAGTFGVSCGPSVNCSDVISSEAASPDGGLRATVFQRDCGATTAISTHVVVRHPSEKLDSARVHVILILETDSPVTASWKSSTRLVVSVPKGSKVFRKEPSAAGVKIEYDER